MLSRNVAILIDGGYFIKRLPAIIAGLDKTSASEYLKQIRRLTVSHLEQQTKIDPSVSSKARLYRVFYYDARPYQNKEHAPISKTAIDFSKSPEANFRNELFSLLRKNSSTAVRLGQVVKETGWRLKSEVSKDLLKGCKAWKDLGDDDFVLGLRQKTVDMRIGLDICSLALKKQVDTIVLVAGDADFVPAAKFARREGIRVILDPLWRSVSDELFEHIDGLTSGFPRPKPKNSEKNNNN